MSEPVYPENAFSQSDPNPEGDDVDPDFMTDEPSEPGAAPMGDEEDDVEEEDLNDLA